MGTRKSIATALVASALALGACGGDEPAERASPKAAAAYVELEDQLGFGGSGILARQNRVEQLIRDCMKRNGFDYVPVDPFAGQSIVAKANRLNDKDFVEQFGYGISTLWGRGGARVEDPNQRMRASLSPADRRAYDRALWGDYPRRTFVDAVDSGDLTKIGGCTKKASQTAFGDGRVIASIVAKFDALDERIGSDQRLVKAEEAWTSCMAAAGYRVGSSGEIEDQFTKRMERIVGPIPGPLATGPPAGERARSYDPAALAALQREEVTTARADYACEQKHILPVEAVVRTEYETQFRDQNQALIQDVKQVWKP